MPEIDVGNFNNEGTQRCNRGDCIICIGDVFMIVQIGDSYYRLISISDANRFDATNVYGYLANDIVRLFDEETYGEVIYVKNKDYSVKFISKEGY